VKQVFDRPSITPSAIVIVGSGVVGTATGEGFLELGHDVTFVDISARRVRELQDRGLNASTTVDLPADREAFIILTLPTPNVGHASDLSAFTEGTAAVGRALATSAQAHTVVVRSTVPPGTSDELVRPVLERESGKTAGTGFELASNPEFLRAASAVEDFRNPWMTVIASRQPRTIARMRELLAPFGGEVRTFNEPAASRHAWAPASSPPTASATPANARPRAGPRQDPASTDPRRLDQPVRGRSLKPLVRPVAEFWNLTGGQSTPQTAPNDINVVCGVPLVTCAEQPE
jgi:UDP-N-acetyl-D-mannosaminuronate dehydrogenase